MADRPQIPASKFPEKVRRFVTPEAPERLRDMLAKGLVPMKPVVQVCALYQTVALGPSNFAEEAVRTIRRLPDATLVQVSKQRLLPCVLDWLSEVFRDSDEVLQAVLLNALTGDTAVLEAAAACSEGMSDLIARNQIRLIREPAIIESLYFNRNTRASTADRILDFAARNDLELNGIPNYREVVAAISGQLPKNEADAKRLDERFKAAKNAIDDALPDAEGQDSVAQSVAHLAERLFDEEGHDEPDGSSANARIRELNVSQKVRLALMGSAAERGILIRDSNKLVCRTVIRSPAVTDSEVMLYAKNKSLPDDVISYIASNRKWIRHYQVKMSLVLNPKTPLSDSLNFLTHLRMSDLRSVARSRDVPPPVSKAAKNLIKNRSGG